MKIFICIILMLSTLYSFEIKWTYPEQYIYERMTFGSSAAIADLGPHVNNEGGEPDSFMEIVVGSDEYLNFYPEIRDSAQGIWRCIDSRGNLEWAISTGTDESRSSPAVADFCGDSRLDIVGGTTSGWNVEIISDTGSFIWVFPDPPERDGRNLWHSSPAVADVVPSVAGLEIVIGNNSCHAVYCFQGDPSDMVDDGIHYDFSAHTADCFFSYTGAGGTDGIDWDILWVFDTDGPVVSTPALGDIDGDGDMDVVVGDGYQELYGPMIVGGGNIYCIDGPTGTLRWRIDAGESLVVIDASPALADFDADGDLEVVVGASNGKLYFIDGDENSNGVIDSDEMSIYMLRGGIHSSAAIADVNGDGEYEVVVGSNDGVLSCFLYIPPDSITVLWADILNGPIISSPAVAGKLRDPAPWPMFCRDVRRDNFYPAKDTMLYIFVATLNGVIYKIRGIDGAVMDSIRPAIHFHTSPVMADIDYDCEYELVITGMNLIADTIYCIGTGLYREGCKSCAPIELVSTCPPADTVVATSCISQIARFTIAETTGWDQIDTSQFLGELRVKHRDGTIDVQTIDNDFPNLSISGNPSDTINAEISGISWNEGDSVWITLGSMMTMYECTTIFSSFVGFVLDTTPPVISPGTSMPPLGGIADNIVDISFDITDNIAGILTDSIFIRIYAYHVDGTVDSGDIRGRNSATVGFLDNDSVVLHVRACDNIHDYGCSCPPNCDSIDYWFLISGRGPVANIILPANNTISACVDQQIWLRIYDSDGIDTNTIILVINSDTFTCDSTELSFKNDTLFFVPPPNYWFDGETVYVSLIAASDVFGNELSAPLSWRFFMDFSPPVAAMTEPEETSVVYDQAQTIKIYLFDSISSVCHDSIKLYIENIEYNANQLSYQENYVIFEPEDFGLIFMPGDTVDVRIYACDLPDTCGPNCAEYGWQFYLAPPFNCARMPNPFTPNMDLINDYIQFTFPGMLFNSADIYIFDLHGRLVKRIYVPNGPDAKEFAKWDGTDDGNHQLPEGLYIYIIEVKGEVVCTGTITLAR